MVTLIKDKVWILNNEIIEFDKNNINYEISDEEGRNNTIAWQIISSHNISGDNKHLKLKFDSLTSHDITYVGVIQTAKASGLKKFPIPYVLTNCHNSLCAVGGTLNDDDHLFGLTAAKKYGGIYVPPNQAVIHQYMREVMSGCGKMILGTDSHTRYGALGTMGFGEGGGEIVKQLLQNTYDIDRPEVIAIYLQGKPKRGIGPQDIALAIIREVFSCSFVKNKIVEFIGPGIKNLSMDFRNGIDVMTTETACLSSIWCTDEKVNEYFKIHKRPEDYKELRPKGLALYDGLVKVELDKIESMIALPFHPSNAYTIKELNDNLEEILKETERKANLQIMNSNIKVNLRNKIIDGRLKVDQGEIAGCAGGMYENIKAAMEILKGHQLTNGYYSLNIYAASTPIYTKIMEDGSAIELIKSGAIIKTAFCGPCFGAGDVPANGSLSIRHTTRNFPNREGSKPSEGQIATVALMDARSIAATSLNGGFLTAATDLDFDEFEKKYTFDDSSYSRVYNGFRKEKKDEKLIVGPNISEWPEMSRLNENILLKVASVIKDPVTTTDELIPSGEASTYRSNPIKMAEFTLSRRDPGYLPIAKEMQNLEKERSEFIKEGKITDNLRKVINIVNKENVEDFLYNTSFGSVIYAIKPGDGSAREQAASCQKVLGGLANICVEYATKIYRSNLINWGIIPFTADKNLISELSKEDYIYIENIKSKLLNGDKTVIAKLIKSTEQKDIELSIKDISKEEKEILLEGCLINYYKNIK